MNKKERAAREQFEIKTNTLSDEQLLDEYARQIDRDYCPLYEWEYEIVRAALEVRLRYGQEQEATNEVYRDALHAIYYKDRHASINTPLSDVVDMLQGEIREIKQIAQNAIWHKEATKTK